MDDKTIGKDFSLKELLLFVIGPTITQMMMSLLMSLDDSLFISRYVGEIGLACFSVCLPIFMFTDVVSGFLMGATTLCSNRMGDKDYDKANAYFTSALVIAICTGLFFTVTVLLFENQILNLFGATEMLMPYCRKLTEISAVFFVITFLNRFFQNFYLVAGKPSLNTVTIMISAFCNIFFDYLFLAVFNMGIMGTAFANVVGNSVGVIIGIFFFTDKKAEIRIHKPDNNYLYLIKRMFVLGLPRISTALSIIINQVIINHVLLSVADETALSANSVVNGIGFIFISAFLGMSGALSPIISYSFGEKNKEKLSSILRKSVVLLTGLSVFSVVVFSLFKNGLLNLYISEKTSETMIIMAKEGLSVYPVAYVFFWLVILGEEGFASLMNTKASTVISVCECFIFSNGTVLTLPFVFGMKGFWWSMPLSEILTFIVALYYVYINRDNYGYGLSKKALLMK